MEFKGASVYDQDDFLNHYLTRRHRDNSPNNIIEKPVIMELIGDVNRMHVLDLGCGDAEFGYELIQRGCQFYEGIEGSSNMVKKALAMLDDTGHRSQIHHTPIEMWGFPEDRYNLVVSRLVLHYLEALTATFKNVYSSLKEDGTFIFSVQHPILTSSLESARQSSKRTNWIVDDYFAIGKRVEPWIDQQVVKYHRTVEEYFRLLKEAGFKIDDLRECHPRIEYFRSDEDYQRRQRIPLFLLFSCRK